MKHFLKAMMTRELQNYISERKLAGQPNRKNAKGNKTVRGLGFWEFELGTERDRFGTFDPKLHPDDNCLLQRKWNEIGSVYAMGMNTRAMRDYFQECMALIFLQLSSHELPTLCCQLYRNAASVYYKLLSHSSTDQGTTLHRSPDSLLYALCSSKR